MMKILSAIGAVCFSLNVLAHVQPLENFDHKPVLADLSLLRMLNIPVLAQSNQTNVGFAQITPQMQQQMQEANHRIGRCGIFEALDDATLSQQTPAEILQALEITVRGQDGIPPLVVAVEKRADIAGALDEISIERMKKNVEWFASFPNRYNQSSTPNKFGDQFLDRLKTMLQSAKMPYEIEMISHKSTPQKSIRVRLSGRTRPDEIVVLGAHMDSINQSFWGATSQNAPGADDNASGSSNLIETLQILMQKNQPERTLEFFWYAGEESGLLGSAEIAKSYKAAGKNIIGVLQLDMTLMAGAGEFVLGSMTDFTNATMREYLKQINTAYNLGGKIVDDKCGYGCSDHASWYRQGYPTLMPFEATFNTSNQNIHTEKDVISATSNFNHSAMFTKIALVLAMDLGNNNLVFQ